MMMKKINVEVLRKLGKRQVGDRYEIHAPWGRQLAMLGFVKEVKEEEVKPKRQYRRRDMVAEGNRELVSRDFTADTEE